LGPQFKKTPHGGPRRGKKFLQNGGPQFGELKKPAPFLKNPGGANSTPAKTRVKTLKPAHLNPVFWFFPKFLGVKGNKGPFDNL